MMSKPSVGPAAVVAYPNRRRTVNNPNRFSQIIHVRPWQISCAFSPRLPGSYAMEPVRGPLEHLRYPFGKVEIGKQWDKRAQRLAEQFAQGAQIERNDAHL